MPTSARHQDQNGYLLVKGCPIASFGIFQYSAAQLGLDGDPNRIVNVFRPESEVSSRDYLDSFQVVPFINDHEMLSGFQGDETAVAPEEKGIDGVLFDVGYAAPWVTGDIKIFSRSAQADLSSGKKDLSLGYTCDFEIKSGTWNGQDYEVVQMNMRGNHIALVDVGRVPGARVLDGRKLCFDRLDFQPFIQPGVMDMPKGRVKRAMDSTVVAQLQAQLKALLPTFEQFLSEEATEPAHQAGAGGAEGAEAGAENAGGAAEGAAAAAPAEGGETGTGEVSAAAAPGATEEGEGESDAGAGAEAGAGTGEGGEAGGEAGGGDLASMLDQLIQICTQLKAAAGGAAGDEGGEGEGAENAEGATGDTVEGLEGTAREGTDGEGEGGAGESGNGSASAGPAAGKHTGADAALRTFYADAAVKDRLYGRLSKVVGAFDGAMDVATATSADIARYGVKKLGIKCEKGTEVIALDAYLTGVEKARNHTAQTVNKQRAADAAAQEVPAIDAYFKE